MKTVEKLVIFQKYLLFKRFSYLNLACDYSIRDLIFFTHSRACLGMVYYTLSWTFADLGGDIYLNFILASLVELPMHAVCVVCLQRY